jgi:hypothetical protein
MFHALAGSVLDLSVIPFTLQSISSKRHGRLPFGRRDARFVKWPNSANDWTVQRALFPNQVEASRKRAAL